MSTSTVSTAGREARLKRLPTLWSRSRPAVMGIVNCTPDSFSDGGQLPDTAAAVGHADRLISDGADIIDVGGESTRPGARPVAAEEEVRRVLPVIEKLRTGHPDLLLSVDTSKAVVAEAALDAGADIVNDVTSAAEPRMSQAVAEAGAVIILMHMRGTPRTMQTDTTYRDVVAEVHESLRASASRARRDGIPTERIWLDPGIGFGKRPQDNAVLIGHIEALSALGYPVLVGASRKSFIGAVSGAGVDDRLAGTLAVHSADPGRRLPANGRPRPRRPGNRPVPEDRRVPRRSDTVSWLLDFLRELTQLQVSFADLADILTVAILVYILLVLLRGSRAMQMLLLYLGAESLGLVTLSTILRDLLFYLPFAMIVLFQQEIRRMLTAFGSTSWVRLFGSSDDGPVLINELALAAQALAAKKTGALIAVERRDSLAAWAGTGIRLEARFSYDLLLNIFIPGTPLHDGAVILRGDRIAAASCFLPLTTRPEISTELGTRHRAAIGLSEETDALVVVVSEETGTISLAVEGQLLRPLDETTLRNALAEHLYLLRPSGEEAA